MHSHQLHRHPARQHAILENNDSLANIVERAEVEEDDGVATLYSVVYVTASATFSGPTAGYVTVGLSSTSSAKVAKATATDTDDDATTTSATVKHTTSTKSTASTKSATTSKTVSSASSTASNKSASQTTLSTKSATSSASTSSVSSDTTSSVASSSVVSSSSIDSASSSTTLPGAALAQATVSSSASASASSSPAASPGLSSGAKGGIAFAVLLGIAFVAGMALLFNRRRKNNLKAIAGAQRLADDEKRASPPPPVINTPPPVVLERTTSPAPRLTIRPTSRFSLGTDPEKAAAGIAAASPGGQKASVWERPGATRWPTTPTRVNTNNTTDPANPFGIHAETVNNSPPSAGKFASPTPMFDASASTASFELQGSPVTRNPLVVVPSNSTPAVVVDPPAEEAVSPVEPTSPSTAPASPSEMISPSVEIMSPTKAEFGTASAVPFIATAGAGAGAPSGPAPGENVHRVQLEFKPSMDDEIGLTPGQLVRLLHEYDDGWALCMNMDRSKQGVAPRSCVSKLPLKQRPVGPPNGRPMSPRGPAPLAQGGRKVSGPPGPRGAMAPKPLSPGTKARMFPPGPPRQRTQSSGVGAPVAPRSMSPGPNPSKPMADTRSRSASVGSRDHAAKPANPSGPSPPAAGAIPARKPVPGQAL